MPGADGLAVDVRGAGEAAVVRRALDLEDRVRDREAAAGELLLELGLVVHVALEGVLDALLEGLHDRGAYRLEPVLEVERAEAGLDQSREDVAIGGEPEQLVAVDLAGVPGEQLPEAELAPDDGAAVPRDDVRADLRQGPLRLVREALVEVLGDREAEDAVAEKLEALVGVRPATRPGSVREGVVKALGRKRLDQVEQRAPRGLATGATRCSRLPGPRSGSAERLRQRS